MLIAKRPVMVQAASNHPWFVLVMPKAAKIPAKETLVDLWLCQRAQVMIQVHKKKGFLDKLGMDLNNIGNPKSLTIKTHFWDNS